ncbi:MAG: Rpn family recombination-promoting nuclease/putative transposase [Caldilineaceae bacterium SB0665_bin_21]|nr:Rpn family recombination-promoting nuclease/putative transposase [Caldilineaceae bacterium SB0665_bin_21]
MAVHDRRYKRILTSPVFAYDVARLLADEFNLGTVARPSLRAGPTSSVRESERERIADAAWTFDTERQRTVMMIVEAQSSRQRHLAVRLLRYVVDRLLELCEDWERYNLAGGLPPVVVAVLYTGPERWRMPSLSDLFSPLAQALMRFEFPLRYYDIHHMDRREDPEQPLLRLAFAIERAGDPSETVSVAEAVRALPDEEAYALMTRFLSDKMRQWINLRDARGRRLVDVDRLDDGRPLKEVEREMETIQERFNRLMDERHTAGLTAGRAEGEIVGVLVSFRRALADSGLDPRLAAEVEAHADRIVEAARRGIRFDLDDIPDAARLMAVIRDGGGPARVSAERIWALLPHIPEEDAEPE